MGLTQSPIFRPSAACLVAPAGLALLFLTSCGSTGDATHADMDGPVFGQGNETRFVASTDSGMVRLDDVTRIAKTIRKYKNLGANDQEIIRRVASLKFDGLVASQMQILAPQYERKKAAVRRETAGKIATLRKQASAARKPAPQVEQEVAQVMTGEAASIAQIDLEWKSAARAEVARQYGTDFAVPVTNREGKAVVAFASVRDSGVSVSAASYELAGTAGQLVAAAKTARAITHEGRSYALLDTQASVE